jgi:hypothetical protein
MIRIIVKTEKRIVPGAPIVTHHQIFNVAAPEVAELIRGGGYSEDGTFEVSSVVSVEVPQSSSSS